MRRKIITLDDLQDFWGSQEWEIKPIDFSPVDKITLPPTFEFVTVSGCLSRVSNYSGPSIAVAGMDIFRRDLKDYPYLINANHYSIYSTGGRTLFEIIETKPGYHWIKSISEIPEQILAVLPEKTKEKIENLLMDDFKDIIGLGIWEKKNGDNSLI